MGWFFYIVLLAAGLGIGWAISEYTRAPHKPEPGETQRPCCYNCPVWYEDALFESCDLSGVCTKNSTDKVMCYTAWNFVCEDYSGNAPKEEKRG